jgi:hypothetical protein
LPLYARSEESKRWWKFHPHGDPRINSQLLLKQTHKYWAVNDEMLLSDVSEKCGPEDPFKINRIPKPKTKDVTNKVTNVNHFDNNGLTDVIAPRKDHKPKVTWSEHNSKFYCKERLFDKIIQNAQKYEANDLRRENETEQFHNQRKRGTTVEDKNQKSSLSVSIQRPAK